MSLVEIDSVEISAWVAAVLGTMFSAWALHRALSVWRDAIPSTLLAATELKQVALRRVRQQSFHLLVQCVLLLTTTVTLFVTMGEKQSTIRSYAFAMISLLMLFRASVEHWEQRSVDQQWDGKERRKRASASRSGEPTEVRLRPDTVHAKDKGK